MSRLTYCVIVKTVGALQGRSCPLSLRLLPSWQVATFLYDPAEVAEFILLLCVLHHFLGAVCIELLKILQRKPKEKYMNFFCNLAIPMFTGE